MADNFEEDDPGAPFAAQNASCDIHCFDSRLAKEGRIMPRTPASRIGFPTPDYQPYLLALRPSRPVARQWAERAWRIYPPVATLIAAVVLAAGCRGSSSSAADAGEAGPRLAVSELEANVAAGEALEAPAAETFAAYPSDLPLVGTAAARATVRHGKDRLEIANLSRLPWTGGQIWINRQYSAALPPHTKPGEIRRYHFSWFRDENGEPFPTDNSSVQVEQVELVFGDERTRVRFALGY